MHDMWIAFMWSGLGVMAIVYALIFWCIVRYRKRAGDTSYPGQFRRNNRMEVVYTGIPLLMAVGLFAITYPAERHVETIAPSQDVVVNVTGYRWSWRFDYPELGIHVMGLPTSNATTANGGPTMLLPVDATARFNVTSVDVDHSFWVPAFLFKRDAIPGLQNVFDWTPNRQGSYRGECAEFCGLDHANMGFTVRVVTRPEFDRWVASQKRVALQAGR